jgi:thiosulfate/3-mercaptopyruvate sulfurtransferase
VILPPLFPQNGWLPICGNNHKVVALGIRKIEDYQEGHIPGAVNLLASEAYTKLGTFKKKDDLENLAIAAVGKDKSKEILTYCDAGKCCPTWALILTSVLGYKNDKPYDGSFAEWTKDSELPVSH